jgi:hypothetical protein
MSLPIVGRPRHAVIRAAMALLVVVVAARPGAAQELRNNFPDRKAIVVNNAPAVELSDFSFKNVYSNGSTHFEQHMKWKNVATQAITAFEIVVLKYDPFGRRLIGSRWTVTGKNSGDWTPLPAGAVDGDGTRALSDEEVFIAIAYVRHVRLTDGTVWTANDLDLLTRIRKALPDLKDFGDLKPDPKVKPSPGA